MKVNDRRPVSRTFKRKKDAREAGLTSRWAGSSCHGQTGAGFWFLMQKSHSDKTVTRERRIKNRFLEDLLQDLLSKGLLGSLGFKDKYSWVSSAYKWFRRTWATVNRSGPRTEPTTGLSAVEVGEDDRHPWVNWCGQILGRPYRRQHLFQRSEIEQQLVVGNICTVKCFKNQTGKKSLKSVILSAKCTNPVSLQQDC